MGRNLGVAFCPIVQRQPLGKAAQKIFGKSQLNPAEIVKIDVRQIRLSNLCAHSSHHAAANHQPMD
jgi:hypothetical protein